MTDGVNDFPAALALKGTNPAQHLVHDNTKTPEITLAAKGFATRLFGRHVWHCARRHSSGDAAVRHGRQTEIQQLRRAVRGEHDVARLHISMHDAARVRRAESTRDVAGDVNRFSQGEWSAAQPFLERLTVVERHRDEWPAFVGLPDLVNRANVDVLEPRCSSCLEQELIFGARRHTEVRRQELQRHVAVETRVVRAIHAPHATCADQADDLVATADSRYHSNRRLEHRSGESTKEPFARFGMLEERPQLRGERRVVAARITNESSAITIRHCERFFEHTFGVLASTVNSGRRRAHDSSPNGGAAWRWG